MPFIQHMCEYLIKLTPGTFQLQKRLLTTSSQKKYLTYSDTVSLQITDLIKYGRYNNGEAI